MLRGMKTLYWIIGIVVLVLAGAVARYGLSPLFNPLVTDEALPEGVQQAPAEEPAAAEVVGTPGHPASGTVRIIEADGTSYVRYENLKTINGPDLYVYLANDLEANDFVDLGRVKSTEGNANYAIPAEVDPSDYRYVLIWCKQFSVLFNAAEINPA